MEEISIAVNGRFEEMIDNSELNNKVISAEILEKIDIEKINYLVMNINFSIEELNKELSKLKLIE